MKESSLLATLRRYAPSQIIAHVGDDERKVAVPNVRNRWSRVIATLDAIAWSRIELQDKSGALLHALDNKEPAGELAELGVGSIAGRTAEVATLVNIVVRAQENALRFRNEEVLGLIRAQSEVTRELTAGMRALTGLYQEQLNVARETAQMQADAAADAAANADGDQMKQLIEALPTLLQALPAIKAMLGSGPVSPNGARKPA